MSSSIICGLAIFTGMFLSEKSNVSNEFTTIAYNSSSATFLPLSDDVMVISPSKSETPDCSGSLLTSPFIIESLTPSESPS